MGTISEEPNLSTEKEDKNTSSANQDAHVQEIKTKIDEVPKKVSFKEVEKSTKLSVTEIKVTKRVLKIAKHIKEFQKEYSPKEILKWDLLKKASKNRIYWLDFSSAIDADIATIGEQFNIHPLTIEDIQQPDLEKIEAFDDRGYLFCNLKALHYRPGTNEMVSMNMSIVLFSNFVLSFHNSDTYETVVEKVLHRIQQINKDSMKAEKVLQTSDWILYALLDTTTDLFDAYVQKISWEADALDELVLLLNSEEQHDLLRRIGIARRMLTLLRTQVRSKREILESLTNRDYPNTTPDIKVYLRDVQDGVLRLDERLSAAKETLTNLHNTYLARISIEQAIRANEVNSVMKLFSAVATIFMPLSFIAGLFGMNVQVPGEHTTHLGWFFGIVGFCALTVIISIIWFKRRGWF